MNIFEQLGIPRPILLAPMEDVTDISFRLICRQFGADMVYTEFVNADGLVRSAKPTKTRLKLRIHEAERPIGIQIYGGDIDTMMEAARIAEEQRPEILDINAGCWVKNVALRGAGAGLLRDLPRMVTMADAIVRAVSLPVTLKTRLGWDAESIRIVELAQMLEDVGVRALTVHCRTRDQGHRGAADWSWIPRIREAVSIPVVLNGDVLTGQDVRRAFETTGCDGVMIARGAIANPWIFREAKQIHAGEPEPAPPDFSERVRTCLEHLALAVAYKGERRAIFEMRKHYAGYFKGVAHFKQARMRLMVPETFSGVQDILLDLEENVSAGIPVIVP